MVGLGTIKLTIEVNMDINELKQGSKEATKQMEEFASAMQEVAKKMGISIEVLAKFKPKLDQTKSTFSDLSSSMRGFSSALLGIHMTVLGLVFSLTSINRTMKMVENTQRDLSRATFEAASALVKYGEDSIAYSNAQSVVEQKSDDLRRATEDLQMRQAFLNETYIMLGLNILPMVIGTYNSYMQILKTVAAMKTANAAGQAVLIASYKKLSAEIGIILLAMAALIPQYQKHVDTTSKWIVEQVRLGKSMDEINDQLAWFDRSMYVTWERYRELSLAIQVEDRELNTLIKTKIKDGYTLEQINYILEKMNSTRQITIEEYKQMAEAIEAENIKLKEEQELTKETNRQLDLQNMFFRTVVSATDEYTSAINAALPAVVGFIDASDWAGLSAQIATMASTYGTSFENIAASIFGALDETKDLVWANEEARLEWEELKIVLDALTASYTSHETELDNLQDAYRDTGLEIDKNENMIEDLQDAVVTYGNDIPAFAELMDSFKTAFGESSAEVEWLTGAMEDDKISIGEAETAMELLRQKNVDLKDAQEDRRLKIDELKATMDTEKEKMEETKTKMDTLKETYAGLEKVVGTLKDVLEKLVEALNRMLGLDYKTNAEDVGDIASGWQTWAGAVKDMDEDKLERIINIPPGGGGARGGTLTPKQSAKESPVMFNTPTPVLAHSGEVIGGVEALAKMFGGGGGNVAEPREIVNEITVVLDGRVVSKTVDRRLAV